MALLSVYSAQAMFTGASFTGADIAQQRTRYTEKRQLALSPDGHTAIIKPTGVGGMFVNVIDRITKNMQDIPSSKGIATFCLGDAKTAYLANKEGKIAKYVKAEHGNWERNLVMDANRCVSCIAVNPTNTLCCAGTTTGKLDILCTRLFSSEVRLHTETLGAVVAAAWSNDGKHIYTGSQHGQSHRLCIWDVQNAIECDGKNESDVVQSYILKEPITSLTTDGDYVLTGHKDGMMRIFDVREKKDALKLKQSDQPIIGIYACGNGRYVYHYNDDEKQESHLGIWDAMGTACQFGSFKSNDMSVTYANDGAHQKLVCATDNNELTDLDVFNYRR